MAQKIIFIVMFFSCWCTACNSTYTIKQMGYFNIVLPEKSYQRYNEPSVPYSFEYPKYAIVSKTDTLFGKLKTNASWLNIRVPQLNAQIYLTYKKLDKTPLSKLVNEVFVMVNKHTVKASGINDSLLRGANPNVSGMYFKVSGNTATANQFYVTDSVHNFLYGSLYFTAQPNEDSLSIVNDFLMKDIAHLINTLAWK